MTASLNLLDAATRPKAPRIEGVTPEQRRHGRRLAMIHRLYLQQMGEVRQVMEEVARGESEAERLGKAVSSMQMVHNYQVFGTLCGRQCAALALHHTIEDHEIFPALAGRSEGLRRVIERLQAEHRVIHELLERLQAHAGEMMREPGAATLARLRESFEALETAIISHFGYEQEELEEALGYWNIPI